MADNDFTAIVVTELKEPDEPGAWASFTIAKQTLDARTVDAFCAAIDPGGVALERVIIIKRTPGARMYSAHVLADLERENVIKEIRSALNEDKYAK